MTEDLLGKLEEKMMVLLTEVEAHRKERESEKEKITFLQSELDNLRKEVHRLNQDNSSLRYERENHARKIQDILSLLDTVNAAEPVASNLTAIKPVLVQG